MMPLILGVALLVVVFAVFAAGAAAQIVAVDCQDGDAPLVILSAPHRRHPTFVGHPSPSSSPRPRVPASPGPDLPCLRCGTPIPETGRVIRCLPETGHPVTEIELCEACGSIRESLVGYPKELPYSDTFHPHLHPQDHADVLADFIAARTGITLARRPGCQTYERKRGPATPGPVYERLRRLAANAGLPFEALLPPSTTLREGEAPTDVGRPAEPDGRRPSPRPSVPSVPSCSDASTEAAA